MNAKDVARVLAWAAESEEEPDRLTNMRVQKLLYYVQGWALAKHGRPLFPERIEAWVHGPVVRELYGDLKRFGSNAIDPRELGDYDAQPTDEEVKFVRSVWEAYKDYSTTSLRAMSHDESPWRDARAGLEASDPCEREITPEAMRAFFSQAA